MKEIDMKVSFKKKRLQMAFLILCNLFISENALSRQHWNRSLFDVLHNVADNQIEMEFEFYDYDFGPAKEDAYLKDCYIQYSSDGKNFYNLITVKTVDQGFANWTWMYLLEKLEGAKIQFGRCYVPGAGKMWDEGTNYYRIEVYNCPGNKAWFNIIWHLENKYQKVRFIRLVAIWYVNGFYTNDILRGIVYEINKFIISESKTPVIIDSEHKYLNTSDIEKPESNEIKISKERDAIVIKGAQLGENINVYSTSGALVQSLLTTNNEVKIKLPENQIYIVHVGQAHYKIAL